MFKNCLIYMRNNVQHVYDFVSRKKKYFLGCLKDINYIFCKYEKKNYEVFKKFSLKKYI